MNEENPFLKLFEDQWGVEQEEREPRTIRELIALAQRCRVDESLEDRLRAALEDLLPKIVSIHQANVADMENSRHLAEDLLVHLEGSLDAYEQIADSMEGMLEGEFEALEDLEAGAELLAKHQNALERWHSGVAPACPKCGGHAGPGEKVCPDCQAHYVYADSSETEFETVTLGPAYGDIHTAAAQVATGDAPFSDLEEKLRVMDTEVNRVYALLAKLPEEAQKKYEVPKIRVLLEDSLLGLAQLRRFDDSCELADLNQGWKRLSQTGVRLSAALKAVVPELMS